MSRSRRLFLGAVLAASLAIASPMAVAAFLIDSHDGVVSNLGTTTCDPYYAHAAYNDTRASWTYIDESGSACDWIRTGAYWYHEDLGWTTHYGPWGQVSSYMEVHGILQWGHHKVCRTGYGCVTRS